MRIIAGQWRGCRLVAPAGEIARPTTDRVKEAMFNLMGHFWQGGVAVDLFAGSGALALEALSRGAAHAICVDVHAKSLAAIRENVRRCGAEDRVDVWRMDWRKAWAKIEAERDEVGWVFVDPPYALNLWDKVLAALASSRVRIVHGVVCEHPKARPLPESAGRLRLVKHREYGDIGVSIYQTHPEPADRTDREPTARTDGSGYPPASDTGDRDGQSGPASAGEGHPPAPATGEVQHEDRDLSGQF